MPKEIEKTEEEKIYNEEFSESYEKLINPTEDSSEETDGDSVEDSETVDDNETPAGESEKDVEKDASAEVDKDTSLESAEKEGGEEGGDEYEPIDPRLVAAGRARGWSDEKIIKVAEEDESILETLAEAMDVVKKAGGVVTSEVKPAPKTEDEKKSEDSLKKVVLDDEALSDLREQFGDKAVDAAILPLTEKLNSAIDAVNALRGDVAGQKKVSAQVSFNRKIASANRVFDEASETFPTLGKTKDLPKSADGKIDATSAAFVERSKIFDIASGFESLGMPFDVAMKNAMQWYAGGDNKSLQRKIVKDLNERKKKFSPRPLSKKTQKTYKSREAEGVALITDVMEKGGK